MATAKVFRSGNSQAVRLPKEFRFNVKEVDVLRRGDEIVLKKKPQDLKQAFELLSGLSDDFMSGGRHQLPVQKRKRL